MRALMSKHPSASGPGRESSTDTSVVRRWFGPQFVQLHPLLQQLHLHGGRLSGVVDIHTGTGLAGWFGRRLATAVGIPVDRPRRDLVVEIRHTDDALLWTRTFDHDAQMISTFTPIGSWPDGCWVEQTGALQLRLGVDIKDGAWQWLPRGTYLHGIRLPSWLVPTSRAGKRIENGRYVFSVAFALPFLGMVLGYSGTLEAVTADTPA